LAGASRSSTAVAGAVDIGRRIGRVGVVSAADRIGGGMFGGGDGIGRLSGGVGGFGSAMSGGGFSSACDTLGRGAGGGETTGRAWTSGFASTGVSTTRPSAFATSDDAGPDGGFGTAGAGGGLGSPDAGDVLVSGRPHQSQNLKPASTGCPQFGHMISAFADAGFCSKSVGLTASAAPSSLASSFCSLGLSIDDSPGIRREDS